MIKQILLRGRNPTAVEPVLPAKTFVRSAVELFDHLFGYALWNRLIRYPINSNYSGFREYGGMPALSDSWAVVVEQRRLAASDWPEFAFQPAPGHSTGCNVEKPLTDRSEHWFQPSPGAMTGCNVTGTIISATEVDSTLTRCYDRVQSAP